MKSDTGAVTVRGLEQQRRERGEAVPPRGGWHQYSIPIDPDEAYRLQYQARRDGHFNEERYWLGIGKGWNSKDPDGNRAAWAALAIIAAAPTAANAQTTGPPEPRSCQQLHAETNKCDTGMRSCDQRVVARLQARCQRDEKRLPQGLGPRDSGQYLRP